MDLKTPDERHEHINLVTRKYELVNEKKQHEAEMAQIKNKIRGRLLPQEKYRQCCDVQQRKIQQIGIIERELSAIKVRLREIANNEAQRWDGKKKEDGNQLVPNAPKAGDRFFDFLFDVSAIRDEYRRFSADATRVSSMRRTAAEFANKLDDVIGRFQSQAKDDFDA
jgi:hypothetical protein